MQLRPTLFALALALAAGPAAAQTAAPPTRPAQPGQPNQATARPTSPARAAAPAAKPAPSTAAAAGPAAKPTAKAEPIDINTATSADLKGIPGIGDAYAAKIIANRPYHSKDELTRKKVLPAGVYAKVKDRIIARQH